MGKREDILHGALREPHTIQQISGKRTRFHERASNVKEKGNEKEENDATMMFEMMQEQHQEQLNAIQESNAVAMKTANTAMSEMAKNMQIMMASMSGMSKTAEA